MIRFSDRVESFEYEPDSPPPPNTEAADRHRRETILDFDRKRYLTNMKRLFESSKDTTVVFGNLGRHPHLLTYYVDLCTNEDVSIHCRWETHSPYQDTRATDVVLRLEPDFDEIVEKPPQSQKLFVFTSHLSFSISEDHAIVVCHAGGRRIPNIVQDPPQYTFYPDVLHDRRLPIPPANSVVRVDVSQTRSKIECYLKLLNAIEVLRDHSIVLKLPDDAMSFDRELRRSKNRLGRLGHGVDKTYFFKPLWRRTE
ncbi:hypothetical protein AVEN_57372-1 [Araneus ventricosus]|uniref:Uncharacterized protein n=1 Tax=Araneus ventricosus TaxID=182803 RepID=A0A4Y2S6M6_ARAVE|nr:hypothetical protein AVEN_57372-1 [Araneus ventricosus]